MGSKERKMSDKEQKLCPFRSRVEWRNCEYGIQDETSAPCLEDKCAMWRVGNYYDILPDGSRKLVDCYCGLAGKP